MRVGPIVSSDVFYDPDREQYERWSARGVLAVEMEAAVLFTIGALRGVQAGCLLTVSDIVVGGRVHADLRRRAARRGRPHDAHRARDRDRRPLAPPSSSSTPRPRTARPGGAGPSSRTGRPRSGCRATRSSRSGRASSDRARAQGGAPRRDAARRRRRRRHGERGRERDRRARRRRARRDPARDGLGLRPHLRHPAQARGRGRGRAATGARARSTSAGRATAPGTAPSASRCSRTSRARG